MTVTSECVVCSVSAAKYTCPACGRRTCSVQCCQQHKRQYTCSGQRCQTVAATFVPLAEYRQQHLLDDYHHLERLSRDVEVIRRRRQLHHQQQQQQQQQLQGSSGTLTNTALGNSGRSQRTGDTSGASTGGDKRGGLTRRDEFRLRRIVTRRATGCRLLFLPPLFERHRINTTTTSSYTSTALAAVGSTAAAGATAAGAAAGGGPCRVLWCVEWLLPCDQLRYVTDRVPDNVRLCSVIDQVLKELQRKVHAQHSLPGCQFGAAKSRSSLAVPSVTDTDSPSYEHDPIAIYRAALETRSLCAFLRVEKSLDSQRYRQLSMSRTLCHALRHQCVIEFPTLLLVTSHNAHMLLPAPSNVVDGRLKTGVDNSDVVSGAPCRFVSAVANNSGANSDSCGGRRQLQQQQQLVPPPRLDSVAVVAAEFFSPAAGVAARPASAAEAATVAVRATGGHSWWPAHSVSARPTDAPSDAAAAAVVPLAVPTLSAAAATAALPASLDDSEDVWSDAGDHDDDDDADDCRDHDLAADTDWSVSRPDTSVPDTAGPRHSTLSAETNFGLLGCADDSDCD